MSAILDPVRVALRRGMVEAALRERPAPLLQWSAIVHDDGTEINVTTGRREELIDKLREFAGPAPHTAVGQHLERCAREIEETPEKAPIFSIDPVSACLEFVTEKDLDALNCGARYGENGLLLCGLQRGHDGGHAVEGWQGTADGEGRRL